MWEAIETPRPSAWRVIFKGLTLLEHLLKNGSERCVDDARNHSHILRNLDRFNYYEGTIDRGVGVREKSKQVVEVLQDDERIREERQKARTLREKFSGRGAVSSGSGGGGGGGGSGGVKYEGYGNSDAKWAQSSGAGGSTSYGDSGIGATTSRSANSNKAYGGRYDGEGDIATTSTARRTSSKSSTGGAKVKKPKKKEKAVVPEVAVPELDLFSFDAAPTTSGAPIADHSFDAFGSSSPAPTATMVSLPPPSLQQQMHPSAAVATHDDFGDFATASSALPFDAFGTAPPSAQTTFDAFGSSPPPMATMSNAFGNMSMSSSSSSGPTNMMNTNNSTPANNTAVGSNDDFGDFEDADPFANKSSQTSSDPLSKLISLDGLTKKPKKVEGKPDNGAPIDFSKPLGGMGGAATLGDNFEAPLVLGTGKQGDIGEVFGQLMESNPKPGMMVEQQHNNGMGMTSSAGCVGGMGGQPMYPQMQMGMGQPQQQQQQQGGMMFNQGNMGMMGGNMSQQQMMMMQQQMQMQGGMMQPQMGNVMGMHGQQMNIMGGAQSQPQQKNNMNGNGNNMGW